MNRPTDENQQGRIDAQKREVALRLHAVCRDMPEGEFAQLVDRIVSINLKYLNQRSEGVFTRPGRAGSVEPAKG